MTAKPLKLFWWNDTPNFGDALSPLLVEYVTGRRVEWSSISDADIIALGSIMRPVRRVYAGLKREVKPVIWGTGSIGPNRTDFVSNVTFAAVRGPLTATIHGLNNVAIGDPGVLINQLYEGKLNYTKNYSVGIIPHHSQVNTPSISKLIDETPHSILIDPRTNEPFEIIQKVASCDLVLSSSLHGLISADSLKIPNIWIGPSPAHATPHFKFYDYATSVCRGILPPLNLDTQGSILNTIANTDLAYMSNLDGVSNKITCALKDAVE